MLLIKTNVVGEDRIYLKHLTDGRFEFLTEQSDGATVSSYTTAIADGASSWIYLVFTWDVTNGKRIFVNGVADGVDAGETTLMLDEGTGAANFTISAFNTGSDYFKGKISMFRVRDQVLTQQDVDLGYSFKHDISGAGFSTSNYFVWAQINEAGNTDIISQFDWGDFEVHRTTSAIYQYGRTLNATDKLLLFGRE